MGLQSTVLVLSPPERDPHWVVLVGGSPPNGVSLCLAEALPSPWSDGAACLNGPGLLDEPLEESGTVAVLQAGFSISDQSGQGHEVLPTRPRRFFLAQTSGYSVSNSEGMVCSFGGEKYTCHSASFFSATAIIKEGHSGNFSWADPSAETETWAPIFARISLPIKGTGQSGR